MERKQTIDQNTILVDRVSYLHPILGVPGVAVINLQSGGLRAGTAHLLMTAMMERGPVLLEVKCIYALGPQERIAGT
eukprot:6163482-Pleurochrysis_carterae.AAC.2